MTLWSTRPCLAGASLAAILLQAALLGCNSSPPGGGAGQSRSSETAPTEPNAKASASGTVERATAIAHPFAGTWTAQFSATRGIVHVPKGVRYPAWSHDKGAEATGETKLEFEIDREGRVEGRCTGALGKLIVRGQLEDGAIRAGLVPSNVDEALAMTGWLVATLPSKSPAEPQARQEFAGQLRVANHDGLIVRQATFTLAKNPAAASGEAAGSIPR